MTGKMLELGLTPFFTAQLTAEELDSGSLVRIVQVHRSRVIVSDGNTERGIAIGGGWFEMAVAQRPTVGDWVLLDETGERIERLLERKSIVQRVVPGSKADIQLIAANIDTLFIVTSCNEEFSQSRLERYLSLAMDAGVNPVVVFTKADLIDNPESYLERVREVSATVPVEVVNARDPATFGGMTSWISMGATIGIVGSSGVGKSTLVNTLSGTEVAKTGAIREQDTKGRHTTTHRELYQLPGGGMIIDVPGMRELKVGRFDKSASESFPDIEELTEQCKFANCAHDREQHCAVLLAIRSGNLDARRFSSYQKLQQEQKVFADATSTRKNRLKKKAGKKKKNR